MRNMIILLDGASDEPIPQLNNRTVLDAAHTPFMDSIASSGIFGVTDARGYTHLFLLELLSQREGEVPRGLIETLGFDLEVPPERVAYRLSPAIIKDNWLEWGYNITSEQVRRLKEVVEKNLCLINHLKPRIRYYKDGKGVMTILADRTLDLPSPPVNTEIDLNTLGELREFVEKVMEENDGIVEMPWQGGKGALIEEYRDARDKVRNIVVYSNSPSALGVGAFLGMKKVWINDLEERIMSSVDALKDHDVLLHIEEIDDVSHKRDPHAKLEFINEVDRLLNKYLAGKENIRLSLIVDHGASSLTGEHILDPVPFAVSEDLSLTKGGTKFRETVKNHIPLTELLDILYRN